MKLRSRIGIALLVILGSPVFASAAAGTAIRGTAHNATTGRPAAGDDVILLRLGNGMEEEARVKADAQGGFALEGNSASAQYLVRVVHQGVNYDQGVTGSAPLELKVFDAVPRIKGLTGSIGMAQVESDGEVLKITEMYSISNDSEPPVTQWGPRNFEIILPQNGAFDSVGARRAEGVWIKVPPAPVDGQPGHYTINFPLRPGDTLIKFTYHLPYAGPTSFHLKLPYPIKKFAVMHPSSIAFKATRAGTFTNPGATNGLQVEAAVKQPLVGDVPPFEISTQGNAPPAVAAAPAAPVKPNLAVAQSAGEATQSTTKAKTWLVLAVTGILLLAGLGAAWWIRRAPARISPRQSAGAPPLLDALKEELFHLEVDRARGSISPGEYAATKQVLNRALERTMSKPKR